MSGPLPPGAAGTARLITVGCGKAKQPGVRDVTVLMNCITAALTACVDTVGR